MATTPVVTVRLEPKLRERLDRLAKAQRRSRSFVATEAIREYVKVNEWQIEEIRQALAGKGHQLTLLGHYSDRMGGGQAVLHESSTGVNYGASDPRKDGAAIPEPDQY